MLRKTKMIYIIAGIMFFIFFPTTSRAINSDTLANKIKQQQEQNSKDAKQQDRIEDEENELEAKLDNVLKPIPMEAYKELKLAGVKFANAKSLFIRIKQDLVGTIDLQDLRVNSPRFITFRSYTFMDWNSYYGAFTIKGTYRLIAVTGWLASGTKACQYAVEIRVFYPGIAFNSAGWNRNVKPFSCHMVLDGQATKKIKRYILKIAEKTVSNSGDQSN